MANELQGNGDLLHDSDRLESSPQRNEKQPGDERYRLGFVDWLEQRFNWSWFTCTQSTGGIAIVLSECAKQFAGLQTIGVVVFIFNLVLWLIFTGMAITRWITRPSTIVKSFTKAPENYFFGSFWLSIATIIICMQRFAVPHTGPWMIVAIRVCFWIYAASALLSSTIQFVVIFQHTSIKAIEMSPAWFLIVLQAMLTGVVAGAIAMDQPPHYRMSMIIAGIAYQGFGWMAAFLVLVWFFGHLMESGWPAPSQAPGLFMPTAPVGFTIVALISNASAVPKTYGFFAAHPTAPEVLLIMATWIGVFMWLFGLWLFGLAFFVCLPQIFVKDGGRWKMPMTFNNTWWALIFPNVGFTLATLYLGTELESNAILWVSTAMVILLVVFWLLDLFLMAKAIVMSLFFDARIKLL